MGHWLLNAALFTITRVETGRYRFTAADPLEAQLTTALGRNIWTYREAELTAAVEALPWVREAKVHRRLPGTLRVDFLEWQPLLVVIANGNQDPEISGDLVLLADGKVVTFPGELTRPVLPVLAEVRLESTGQQQWRLCDIEAMALLDLMAAIAASGLEAEHPVDFILPVENGFKLVLQQEQRTLLVGLHDTARQLENFLLTREQDDGESDIDLRCRGKVIFKRDTRKV